MGYKTVQGSGQNNLRLTECKLLSVGKSLVELVNEIPKLLSWISLGLWVLLVLLWVVVVLRIWQQTRGVNLPTSM